MRLPIKMKLNQYGYPVPDWEHWSVRIRLWAYYRLGDKGVAHSTVLFWLYRHDFLLDGEAESCWVGGYEFGEDD